MIDHLLGRPSVSWKRIQVILVIVFWFWRILRGDPKGPKFLWLRHANRALHRFTPWQLIVSTLTGVYAVRNLDKILGLAAPEPLANLYSPSYYRSTWINMGLDAGFATAMTIRPRWLKDICSVLFSIYYIIYASEADEKIRKFRAVPTVEMLRATWEKGTNPYLRMLSHHPSISVRRKILLARPKDSACRRPITAWLYFARPIDELASATDLILDFPGGGFVSMTPEHHEERLRMWAIRTGRPVLSVEYGKAPEYPYPFPIDECFDLYRVLVETTGIAVGMSGRELNIICTGDSAGAHIAVCVMYKILETQMELPHPLALVLNYAALDFNFTSWMTPQNLRVLQSEQSSGHLALLAEQEDHLRHISPLSMVGERKQPRRRSSLRESLRSLASLSGVPKVPPLRARHTTSHIKRSSSLDDDSGDEGGAMGDVEDEPLGRENAGDKDKPLRARIRFNPHVSRVEIERTPRTMPEAAPASGSTHDAGPAPPSPREKAPIGTRLTMTSRTGYFQDRVISPSMMRAMAILYIGPQRNPDFQSDYHLSPILAPASLLARFPPLLMTCGEKDPFVDDTLVFAGRVREAKRARRAELARILGAAAASGAGGNASTSGPARAPSEESLRALRRERARLAGETEDDWVQTHLFSEWSHGYLQMPSLMREARAAVDDLADWIAHAFRRRARAGSATTLESAPPPGAGSAPANGARGASWAGAGAGSGGHRGPPSPTRPRRGATAQGHGGGRADAGGRTPATSETSELDTDEVLSFSPKRRSPPQSERAASSTSTNTAARGQRSAYDKMATRAPSSIATPNSFERSAEPGSGGLGGRQLPVPRSDILHDIAPQITRGGAEDIRIGSPPTRPSSVSTQATRPGTAVGNSGLRGGGGASGSTISSGTPSVVNRGQTISESELMRRRRLLDSHLISTDTVIR